jgi:hypothetical protein
MSTPTFRRSTSAPFKTRAEASAFKAGMETVNDSAIVDIEISSFTLSRRGGGKKYVVSWTDEDYTE